MALAFVLLLPTLAFSEEGTSVPSKYANAKSVFVGELEQKPDSSNEYTAIFEVVEAIKGLQKDQRAISVITPADTRCAYIESGDYLVYATSIKDGLWADPCRDSKHISMAQPDLQYIHTVNPKVSPLCNPTKLHKLSAKAKIIVKAEVVNIKPRQFSCWSGTVLCTEAVIYDVKQVLKGKIADKQIVVDHFLYHNSLTADAISLTDNSQVPQLSPSLFRVGNVLVLFLDPAKANRYMDGADLLSQGIGYVDLDENCGAVTPDVAAGLKIGGKHLSSSESNKQ